MRPCRQPIHLLECDSCAPYKCDTCAPYIILGIALIIVTAIVCFTVYRIALAKINVKKELHDARLKDSDKIKELYSRKCCKKCMQITITSKQQKTKR